MLRLKLTNRAPDRPESHSFRAGFRGLLGCLAVSVGLMLVAPATGLANPITDENAKAGTSGWEVAHADAGRIDGYSDKDSIAPGEALPFRVSTNPGASYRIRIFRLGWYGGAGARLIGCLGSTFQATPTCSTTSTGSVRTTPNPNAQTGEIDDSNNPAGGSWPVTNTVPATSTASWTTGEYVAEYTLTSGTGAGTARYSPFVVRSNAPLNSASSILVIVPVNTYNAYNNWGNTSAYVNDTNKSIFAGNHAYKVSLNRPTYRREWRYWDLPTLRFLEREGYDVSYASDTDVDANPQILQQHQAVIVSGHSEYWSKNMRDGFDAARDAGTNLFFAGANNAYWQVRYEDSSCADDNTVCGTVGDRRTMVIYKQETGDANDPIANSSLKTIKWRDLGRPECELQGGVQYGSWFANDGYRDYTTTAAGAADPWATGSGLSTGSTVSGLVGFEFDSFFPGCNPPGTPTILFSYQGPETSADIDAAAVRYTANGSGARVFSSGSEQWAWGLDSYRWDPTLFTAIPPTNPGIQQYTRNTLADMQRPAAPGGVSATSSGSSIVIDTTPRTDPRITSYKIYRHAGSADFKPGDAGVTLVAQNASGDFTDNPPQGAYRYASVAVDQWNDSSAALSQAVDNFTPPTAVNDTASVSEDAAATAFPVTSNDTNPSGQPITINSVTQPANGAVAITGGGTGLTYKPNANYCNDPPGTSLDTFTYTINGGTTGTVSTTVTCVDDAPLAVHDSKSVVEDDPATAVGVLANDTDIDGGPKEVASFTQPTHGTVTGVGTAGHWTDVRYQPSANYCNFVNGHPELAGPTDNFNYTLNGGSSNSVTVTVDCRDDPAAANDDSATVTEDAAATAVPVLNNDSDVEGDPFSIISATNPAHGTVAITGGGTGLTYKPNADYCGPDSFTYTVTGGDTATVSMTVTCVNDPPVAVNDSATVLEDAAQAPIAVLSNDTDADNDAKTISSATDPAHGTVTLSGGTAGARTTLSYQPDTNYCNNPPGSSLDTFQYTINGGSTATVSVTVNCVDDGPVAHNDAASVNEDAAATAVDVLTNDTDIDGGPKTISSVTQSGNGTVAITGGGTGVTYLPNPNYCNNNSGTPDKFTYTLNGGSTGTVSMTVFCVDDLPVAVHDSKSVVEDDPATAVDVLANDTDVDGGPKTVASVTQPAHGTVVRNGDGSGLTYKPNANYCNFVSGHPEQSGPSDDFNYTLNGGSSASVSITVDCADDPPVAHDDSATVTEDDGATVIPVMSNDTDVDGGPMGILSVTQPTNGTVDTSGGGAVLTYKPNANYCNTPPGTNKDTFSYTLNGGSTGQVSVTVTCVDDLPAAVNDSATVTEDANATAVPVLGNDTDIDGGPKTINSITQSANGTVAITGGGSGLTYKPNANYCNTPSDPADTFTYTLNGGSTATASMTVTCVDDAPHAVNDSDTVTGNSGANAIGVLANDTDIDGGPKTISSFTQPSHGTVAGTGGSSGAWTGLTYDPTNGYCGPDSFGYTLNGGSTATVSITVDCSGAPTAVDDTATFTEDDPATAIDVIANDTDPDGGTNTIQSVTQPANGQTVVTGGGTGLTYKPAANYCNNPPGTSKDTFNYTLNGGSTGQVSVTVTCVDDAPTAVNDPATVTEDASATAVPVLGNDTDVDGGPKAIASVTQPSHGSVTPTGGTTGAWTGLTYTPNPNYCNDGSPTDDFTYKLNGGSQGTVSMKVNCVDDPPQAVDDSFTVLGESSANTLAILANDTDIDGGPKAITGSTQPDNGTVNQTGSTSLTYTPDPGYCSPTGTTDDFTYTLAGGTTATVHVTVDCSQPPVANDDSGSVTEDDPATAISVLSNDTDPDGGQKTIQSASDPAHGTAAVTGGGTGLTYKPDANYCNTPPGTSKDTFTYTLNGGDSATVSMTVTCVDDLPTAVADSPTVLGDSNANSLAVLTNDTDIDGGPKTISAVSDPVHGTVNQTGSTSLTYTPDPGYCSDPGTTDDFTYTLNGGSSATVHVTVDCSQPPVAVDDSGTVNEDDPATAVAVLGNDTDPDGGAKTIQSVTQPANGQVVNSGTSLTYRPNANYCNTPPGTSKDTFTYTINGGDSATVSMRVDCADDPPHAVDDTGSAAEDGGATPITVLADDTDIDGGPKSIDSVTQGSHGTVAITGPGTGLTYDLDDSYCDNPNGPPPSPTDTFTYKLNGGSTATVSVTITCSDDNPVAVDDTGMSVHGNSGPATLDVLSNDTDVDAGPKAIDPTLAQEPQNGTVVVAGDGHHLTYQPDSGYCGDDSFDYKLIPGGDTARVFVNVDCTDPPHAVDDHPAAIARNAPATAINVLANDTDSDGGAMSINNTSDPAHGTVAIDSGSLGLTYQPDTGYCNTTSGATDNFTYTLNGGSTATVFMTVICPNDPPTTTAPEQQVQPPPALTKKCKKGFKKVKGKCKKKKKKKRKRR
jgi:VCBS repeat-containing protein